jgi:AcrR family transcriptional regulator
MLLKSVKTMATRRDTYHHGDLRQALINAALELVTEQDARSLSLREVARRVGVSHTAPYRHFADKDALLATVAEEGFEMLSHSLQAAMESLTADPLQQLEAVGVAYVRYAIEHPSHYRVMFGAYGADEETHPSLAKASRQAFMVLMNVIVMGQSAGVMRTGEPQQLAQAAWSLVHGLAMLLLDGQLPVTESRAFESLSGFIVRILIEGLAIKPEGIPMQNWAAVYDRSATPTDNLK